MSNLIDSMLDAVAEDHETELAKLRDDAERIVYIVSSAALYDAIHGPTLQRYQALCDRVREYMRAQP